MKLANQVKETNMDANKLRKLAGIQAPKFNKILSEELSNEYLLEKMHELGEELLKLQDDYRRVLNTGEMHASDSYLNQKIKSLAHHIDEAVDDIQSIAEYLENN